MIGLVAAFLCGVLFTVFLAVVGALAWAYSQPLLPSKPKGFIPYSKPKLPKSLEEVYGYVNGPDGLSEVKVESCNWFNLIVDFIFREMRDTPEVKRFVMKKISREFTELMLNKTEGKIIEQLTVRDYSFGTSLPVLSRVTILKIECSDAEGKEPVEIDLSVDLDYSGEFQLAIDADLVFNKSAYVSIQILRVKGQGRLCFTLLPFTHWSFSFFEDPEVQMKVKSQLGGRRFPQLSSFIERQIRKWVQRKYTLPAAKVRYKPFFRKYKPQNQLLDVYVHDQRVTVGGLKVEVVECARLPEVEGATKTYCTLCVVSTPCQAQVGLWRATWPVHEFSVRKKESQRNTIGFLHKVPCGDHPDLVLVYMLPAGSSALSAGIKEGDVLTKVNGVEVTSVKQANRLLQRSKDSSILVAVQRPPSHFTAELLRRGAVETTDSGPATAGRDSNLRGTVETDGGEPATSEGKKEQPPPLRKAPRPTQTPAYSHSKSFAAEYGKAALTFLPGDLDNFAGSEDYSYSPTCKPAPRPHPKPHPFRQPDEDSISLCGVMGERGLEGARRRHPGIGKQKAWGHTLKSRALGSSLTEEPATTTSLNGAATSGYASTPSPLPVHPLLPTQPSGEEGVDSVDFGRVEGGRVDGGCDQGTSRVQTGEITACKHPVWDEQFEFELKKEHHYLNVCVWARLAEGRKPLLIGHVTIALMDIALECVSTSSGTHHQRYVLVAEQPAKATSSRVALQATPSSTRQGPGADDPPFVGDIFLRFWHTPAVHDEAEEDQEALERETSKESSPADIEAESSTRFTQHHPFTAEPGHLPSDHDFVIIKNVGSKCDICYKKVWGQKVRKCTHCKLKCHRKCALYCEREVPCYRRGSDASNGVSVDRLRERSDEDFVVYSGDDEDSDMENGNRHRQLEQTPEPEGGCEEAEDSDDSFKSSRTTEDGEGDRPPSDDTPGGHSRIKVTRLYNILREGMSSEEVVDGPGDVDTAAISSTAPDDEKDDSGAEDRAAVCTSNPAHPFLAPPLEGDSSDSEPDLEQKRLWEELCHALYRDLPPPERKANLKQKIRSLQSEIDYISDLINSTAQELGCPGLSPLQEERVREQMDRAEGKLQPLRLLMKQYTMALEYCPESEPS